ncbi:hypothetical protein [uncultured Tateyamaria sp.]|uniref:hypothetical protein n=1 Tax=uncultured Tateyamaria sp. TaxID=455651 RepID=UPI0026390A63|nr:hypothetical protein [uncultured Tateyamaria sp.]
MPSGFFTIEFVLFANCFFSFGVAIYWQAVVIFNLFGVSNLDDAYVPRKAWGNPNSMESNLLRFLAGKIFPDLRRKWLKAIAYALVSFLAMSLVVK